MLHELRHPHVVNMFRVIPLGWPSPDSKALDLEFCGDGDVTTATLSTAELLTRFEQILSALLSTLVLKELLFIVGGSLAVSGLWSMFQKPLDLSA